MPFELLQPYMQLPLLALVCGRIAGVLMFAPLLGGLSVPMQVRVLLIAALTALLAPLVTPPARMPESLAALALALAGELSIGAIMGLTLRMCFVGLQIGGQLIAQESGTAFAQLVDPNSGIEGDTLSMLYVQLGGIVFLIVGGHRETIRAALESFRNVPLLAGISVVGATETLLAATTSGLELALRVAAPVLVSMLIVNVALGFVARTVPQLNVATVGFSIKGVLAFACVAVALPTAMDGFLEALDGAVTLVRGIG